MVVDHLGNKFKTKEDMYKHWGKEAHVVTNRLKLGWSLKDALERPLVLKINKDTVCDPLGNEFKSLSAMCDYWNIDTSIVKARLKRGWTIAEALWTPRKNTTTNCEIAIDHLGNEFRSHAEMCEHWGLQYQTYKNRIANGWSLKDALETPVGLGKRKSFLVDHKGNKFYTQEDLCKYWNIPITTFKSRIERGWDLKRALETPKMQVTEKITTDHLGNRFNSYDEMCKYWNKQKQTVVNRLKNGWTLKEALETPIRTRGYRGKEAIDHLGNHFNSQSEMCSYWNKSLCTVLNRVKSGWSLKDALETPVRPTSNK